MNFISILNLLYTIYRKLGTTIKYCVVLLTPYHQRKIASEVKLTISEEMIIILKFSYNKDSFRLPSVLFFCVCYLKWLFLAFSVSVEITVKNACKGCTYLTPWELEYCLLNQTLPPTSPCCLLDTVPVTSAINRNMAKKIFHFKNIILFKAIFNINYFF